MADDDIEKLLREINSVTPTGSPAERLPDHKESKSGGGRFPFAIASSVVVGGSGAVFGLLFPFFTIVETGLTAASAAFITALIAGPPKWFSS